MNLEVLTKEDAVALFNEMFERRVNGIAIMAKNMIKSNIERVSTMDVYIEEYCQQNHIEREILLSKSRSTSITEHRFIIWYALRSLGFSLTELGKQFNRDHTTVMNGLQRVSDLCFAEPKFKLRVEKAKLLL